MDFTPWQDHCGGRGGILHVSSFISEASEEEEDQKDDEGTTDEREIWHLTDVTEEDFETTEGETVDLYDKLMELVEWKGGREWLDLILPR